MIGVATLIAKLGQVAVEAVVGAVAKALGRKRDSLPEVDVKVSEPPHPGWRDVESMRAQERAAIAPHDPVLCPRCQAGVCTGRGPLPPPRKGRP